MLPAADMGTCFEGFLVSRRLMNELNLQSANLEHVCLVNLRSIFFSEAAMWAASRGSRRRIVDAPWHVHHV